MSLRARDLNVRYPQATQPALAGVDLELRRGELVVLAGENGCGKSTLCHALAGVAPISGGQVTLDGAPLRGPAPEQIQLLQQHAEDQIIAPLVRDDLAFGPECLGLDVHEISRRVTASLTAVGLPGVESREIETLSGGELVRVALAGALAMRPAYLVADEPTAHLDPATAARFVALLRSLADGGAGVLLVTHRFEEAANADRLLLMHDGRLAAEGAPRDLLYDAPLLERLALAPPPVVRAVERARGEGRAIPGAPLTASEFADALTPAAP